ncbi:MAG: hypothetical protein ACI9LM_000765 [Alteromonadaceae bacterium]|jgi:hypothetical protein
MKKVKSKKSLHSILIRRLREWHRTLGVWAAFFLIFLSITGIALNHTERLELAHQPITSTLLLDHYGINSPNDVRFYQDNRLILTNNLIWLDNTLLVEISSRFVTMGKFQQMWLVATDQYLFLFNDVGELIDKISVATGLPAAIVAVSVEAGSVIIDTDKGYYQADNEFLAWQAVSTLKEPSWLEQSKASDKKIIQAIELYRSQFLTWERIIVDAHSGRILGSVGVVIMDIAAILLILLSLSGLYIWIRYANAKR